MKEEKDFNGMEVLCIESHWDGTNYFLEGEEYPLAADYPLPKITLRKNKNGHILKSRPKFEPVNKLAKKTFEKLAAEEEKQSEGIVESTSAGVAIAEVNQIIADNGLDEVEIKELFKKEKVKKAEDKLEVLKKYMES